jgi:UDP-glucose 4-epimerase
MHVIPLAVFAPLGRQPSIKVSRSDYRTPDGTCVRDYVHVSHLADAHIAAIRLAGSRQRQLLVQFGEMAAVFP